MHLRIKSSENLGAGLIFIAIGTLAIYVASSYPMGSILRMGPGFFPTMLGGILAAFGLVITALSFRLQSESSTPVPWALRPWLVLCGSLVLFGLMMHFRLGFIPALAVLVVGTSFAHKGVRPFETAILAVLLPLACTAIFVYGLGLPYRLFWWSH